jgi:hypothetical protein
MQKKINKLRAGIAQREKRKSSKYPKIKLK